MERPLATALVYGVVCGALHLLASFSFDKILGIKYSSLPAPKRMEGYNRFVSLIHSSLMFGLDMRYWRDNHIFRHDRNKVYSSMEKLMIDIMIGYLFYDLIYELFKGFGNFDHVDPPQDVFAKVDPASGRKRKNKGIIEHILIVLHHIAGITSHISTRVSNNPMCYHYSMLVYLAEASTPTLNISWFLYEMKWDKNMYFTIIAYTTVLLFLIVRILLSPYLVLHMLYYRVDWKDGTFLLFYGNLIIMTIFASLNFIWFYKLLNVSRKIDSSKKQ